MKKLIAVFLILVTLTVTLASCAANPEGKWITTDDIITKELVLLEGNKGTYTTLGITRDIIWTVEDGKLNVTETVIGFTNHIYKDAEIEIKGDKLTINENGTITVYTRVSE